MKHEKFRFKVSEGSGDCAYLYLPGNTGAPGIVTKQVGLHDIYPKYTGPCVYLDFNKEGRLIGIDIDLESDDDETHELT